MYGWTISPHTAQFIASEALFAYHTITSVIAVAPGHHIFSAKLVREKDVGGVA